MKTCTHPNCTNTIEDKYNYCYEHYRENYKVKPEVKVSHASERWDDDPLIDVLLKINSNLGGIKKLLDEKYNNHEKNPEE